MGREVFVWQERKGDAQAWDVVHGMTELSRIHKKWTRSFVAVDRAGTELPLPTQERRTW